MIFFFDIIVIANGYFDPEWINKSHILELNFGILLLILLSFFCFFKLLFFLCGACHLHLCNLLSIVNSRNLFESLKPKKLNTCVELDSHKVIFIIFHKIIICVIFWLCSFFILSEIFYIVSLVNINV